MQFLDLPVQLVPDVLESLQSEGKAGDFNRRQTHTLTLDLLRAMPLFLSQEAELTWLSGASESTIIELKTCLCTLRVQTLFVVLLLKDDQVVE
jgi:hypothetical protein